jgi:hypothetical protein
MPLSSRSLYVDANSNCTFDSGDNYLFQPVKIEIDSNGIPVDSISTTCGFNYKASGPAGTVYSFRNISSSGMLNISCPLSGILYDTVSSMVNNNVTKYIGFNCISGTVFDLAEHAAIPVTGRYDQWGNISVSNRFCHPTNATVSLHFSPKYHYTGGASPAPSSISGNTISWNLTGLSATASFPTNIYYVLWYDPATGILSPGDTVYSSITITATSGSDWDTSNNTEVIIDTVRSSCDPNEMTVVPGGYVLPCTQLQYTINFENTGNAPAGNIYVMDTLSDNLDPHSLNILSASAPMNNTIIRDGIYTIAKFDFPGINLPDSSFHDQCNGVLVFNIRTKPGLTDGTNIANHAGIFFDDNPVVMTNSVENIIGLSPIVGPANVCASSNINLSNDTKGGVWASSSPSVATIGSTSGTITGITAGSTLITYSVTNSCASRQITSLITVQTSPAPVTGTPSVCSGSTTVFTDAGGGTWTSSSAAIATVGSASGIVTGISADTAIITYTLSTGCSTLKRITVNPLPGPITGATGICLGSATTLTDGGGGTWHSSNVTIATAGSATGTVTGITAGSATITYTLPTACATTTPVTVNPLPATFAITGGGNYCAGGTGVAVGISGSQTGVSYKLYLGTAVVGSPIIGTGSSISFGLQTSAGTYTIVGENTTSLCTGNMPGSSIVTIDPVVIPSVSIASDAPATLCSGTLVNFNASAINGGSTPFYQWKVNGTNTGTGATYSYVPLNSDVVAAFLTSDATCASPVMVNSSQTMTIVDPGPVPVSITASPGLNVVVGESVTFTAVATGGGSALTYQWYINITAVPGATSSVFTPVTLYNGDHISCDVNNTFPCPQTGSASVVIALNNTGIKQVDDGEKLLLSPNPNKGSFTLTGNLLAAADQEINVTVTDMLGRIVFTKNSLARSGELNESITLTNAASGLYLLNLKTTDGNKVLHFVIEK